MGNVERDLIVAKKTRKSKYPSSFCEYVNGVSIGVQKTKKAATKHKKAWADLGDSIFVPRKPSGRRRAVGMGGLHREDLPPPFAEEAHPFSAGYQYKDQSDRG